MAEGKHHQTDKGFLRYLCQKPYIEDKYCEDVMMGLLYVAGVEKSKIVQHCDVIF
jgi:hypothetical protein